MPSESKPAAVPDPRTPDPVAAFARNCALWAVFNLVLLGYFAFIWEGHLPYREVFQYVCPALLAAAFVMFIGRAWGLAVGTLVAGLGGLTWLVLGAIELHRTGVQERNSWALLLLGGWWLYWAARAGSVVLSRRSARR